MHWTCESFLFYRKHIPVYQMGKCWQFLYFTMTCWGLSVLYPPPTVWPSLLSQVIDDPAPHSHFGFCLHGARPVSAFLGTFHRNTLRCWLVSKCFIGINNWAQHLPRRKWSHSWMVSSHKLNGDSVTLEVSVYSRWGLGDMESEGPFGHILSWASWSGSTNHWTQVASEKN